MVSMKDIAKACGVSVATVSKALNGQKDVGEETRERIKETAKQLGYFPNAQARALKTNKTFNLGVLFVDGDMSGLTHDYFANVLDSFKRAAESRGYDITFINCCKSEVNRMTYLERSQYRGFDGVVIACVDFRDPEVVELVQSGIPVVTIDYIFYGVNAIISDNIKGMQELLTYIFEQGHRRIAYLHGTASAVTQSRLTSFYKTAESVGLEIPEEYIRECAYRDMESAERETRSLLAMKNPPTCIMYPDDFSAFGGINAIRSMGLRIPEDISVAGYDGIPLARQAEPKLTTVAQDTESLGRLAAEKLIAVIEHPRTTIAEQVVIDGVLVKGESVGGRN